MNRLSIATGRDILKRAGLIVMSFGLLAGYVVALSPPYKASAAACEAPAADYGTATATIKVDTAATYQIWSRISAADSTNNSYLLEVDGNTCYVIGDSNNLIPNAWTWVDYQNGSGTSSKARQPFSAGNHTLKMIGLEPGVKLGRVLLVSDLNCVPADNGDNCAVSGDTEAPTVNVTTPATGSTVSEAVNVTASATDNVGVVRLEFYVNGVLKSADTSAPFAFSWDSKTVKNGTVSLTAKAYDTAGNINSDTVQVRVGNGDTQAPGTPDNILAVADAANRVTVSWTAGTDNVAVAGYRVARNGVTLAEVTAGTQYVDNTVLPNMTYRYQVSAYDGAGNNSGLSSVAQAVTPNQPDSQAPAAPSDLKANTVSASQVNLSWAASDDDTGVAAYDVYRSVDGSAAVKVASVTSLSYGDGSLAASTGYAYYVVARDSTGNTSEQSGSAAAQTQATPENPQTGVLRGKVNFKKNQDNRASVVLRVKGVKRTHMADRSGNYAIGDLPPGNYKIRYQAHGSFTKEVTVKLESGKAKTQNVTLRQR